MEVRLKEFVLSLVDRYPVLACCDKEIEEAYLLLEEMYARGGKLLIAGNGGSAADAGHIVGELMKGFCKPRHLDENFRKELEKRDTKIGALLATNLQGALPAIALTEHSALNTAFSNDCAPEFAFAQQLSGYGRAGDAFLALSTSGNSKNVVYAAVTAKAMNMKVIAMTGKNDSLLSNFADVCIKVPETETYKVQELHLPVYHTLCLMLEEKFFGKN